MQRNLNSTQQAGATWQGQGQSASPKGARWQGQGAPPVPSQCLLLNFLLALVCASLLLLHNVPSAPPADVTAPAPGSGADVTAPAPGAGGVTSPDLQGLRAEPGGVPSSELAGLLHPVCWRSTEQGGHLPAGEQLQGTQGIPGVAVYGPGCSFCMVGATCSFSISVMPPASWMTRPGHSQARELNVILSGPALHPGVIKPTSLDDSTFLVTYRVWDAGEYRVSLRSSCGTLNYTPNKIQGQPHEMASWTLVVHPVPATAATTGTATGTATANATATATATATAATSGAASGAVSGPVSSLSSPCPAKKYGRWVLQGDGKHRWWPFTCTEKQEMDPRNWIKALNERGVFEINFVGDSHQRMMLLHLGFLLGGGVNPDLRGVHKSFRFVVASPGQRNRLTLNLGWLGGIYTANNEFGCSNIGRKDADPTWPEVSATADVWVVESGYWTGQRCRLPELALASYLSRFLFWLKAQIGRRAAVWPSLRNAKRPKVPMLIYRPTPPRATEALGCGIALTNKYVRTANRFARSLIPHVGAMLLDSWEIESARFTDNCPNDHHYSCAVSLPNGTWTMEGDVGEADVYALIHFILNN